MILADDEVKATTGRDSPIQIYTRTTGPILLCTRGQHIPEQQQQKLVSLFCQLIRVAVGDDVHE